jgi:hypothetical protein
LSFFEVVPGPVLLPASAFAFAFALDAAGADAFVLPPATVLAVLFASFFGAPCRLRGMLRWMLLLQTESRVSSLLKYFY